MLRVWSSGAYLPGWIYDMADEMGLLLWSEFQFSDAMYPVDADFLANVRAEAEYQVRRLNHHPSLALWAGGNEIENLELWLVNRSAPDQLDHYKGEYETLFLCTLLPAVYENSRSISYIPSSATNGYLSLRHEDVGFPMILRYHNESSIPGIIYGDREYYNYTASIAFVPGVWPVGRFTNEYGFHSLPSAASWRAAVPDPVAASSLRLSDRTVILRNRHYPVGNLTTTNLQNPALGIVEMVIAAHMYYPVPNKTEAEAMRPGANFSAWCHTTQVFQADFVRAQTSFYRVGMGKRQRTLGSLYWMLEDVWQTVSWAGIEHEGRWKVLHYAARDALADVALALIYDPLTSTLDVNVVSDLWVPVRGNVSLAWYAWNGTLLDHVPTTTGVADADTSLWPLLLWPGARDVPFEVGPLNSTLVARINIAQLATPTALFGLWWSFLGFYPPILDTRSSVLLANLTATAVSAYPRASPTEPTRTVTHSAFFTPTPLSAAKLADPVVSVHFDAGADEFIVRADNAIAVWTWLALEEITDDGVIVTFDQNGFLLRKGEERRVKYTVVSGESPGWQSRVTVQSVWDDTLP